ncbi:MAG: hypothetical protein ACM31D_13430 [Bacteroidota bacterium]
MVGRIFDDVRRILLGLLFFVAFGWMGAQVLPGQAAPGQAAMAGGHQQVAQLDLRAEVVPPGP